MHALFASSLAFLRPVCCHSLLLYLSVCPSVLSVCLLLQRFLSYFGPFPMSVSRVRLSLFDPSPSAFCAALAGPLAGAGEGLAQEQQQQAAAAGLTLTQLGEQQQQQQGAGKGPSSSSSASSSSSSAYAAAGDAAGQPQPPPMGAKTYPWLTLRHISAHELPALFEALRAMVLIPREYGSFRARAGGREQSQRRLGLRVRVCVLHFVSIGCFSKEEKKIAHLLPLDLTNTTRVAAFLL